MLVFIYVFLYMQVYSLKCIIILVNKDGEAFVFYKQGEYDYGKIAKKKKKITFSLKWKYFSFMLQKSLHQYKSIISSSSSTKLF